MRQAERDYGRMRPPRSTSFGKDPDFKLVKDSFDCLPFARRPGRTEPRDKWLKPRTIHEKEIAVLKMSRKKKKDQKRYNPFSRASQLENLEDGGGRIVTVDAVLDAKLAMNMAHAAMSNTDASSFQIHFGFRNPELTKRYEMARKKFFSLTRSLRRKNKKKAGGQAIVIATAPIPASPSSQEVSHTETRDETRIVSSGTESVHQGVTYLPSSSSQLPRTPETHELKPEAPPPSHNSALRITPSQPSFEPGHVGPRKLIDDDINDWDDWDYQRGQGWWDDD